MLASFVPKHRMTLPDACPRESGHLASDNLSQSSSRPIVSNSDLHTNDFRSEIGVASKLMHPKLSNSNLHATENVLHEAVSDARNSMHDLCIYNVNIQCLLCTSRGVALSIRIASSACRLHSRDLA